MNGWIMSGRWELSRCFRNLMLYKFYIKENAV